MKLTGLCTLRVRDPACVNKLAIAPFTRTDLDYFEPDWNPD